MSEKWILHFRSQLHDLLHLDL